MLAKKRTHDQMQDRPPEKKTRPYRPRPVDPSAPNQFVGPIKKKLRSSTRLLEHRPDLPAEERARHEQAVEKYTVELEEAMAEKHRQKMIQKYHMVRFFERQKATRLLKRLQKKRLAIQEGSGEEARTLDGQIHQAEVDLNYALYCPLAQKYIALYAGKDEVKDSKGEAEDGERNKPPLWEEVERRMEEGTLMQLRDGEVGKVTTQAEVGMIQRKRKRKDGKKAKGKKEGGNERRGGERGGGLAEDKSQLDTDFFEDTVEKR
ncbi:MAG: 18S rRNA maturation protein [Vezdaea aestivalis]|nr:MAG: 18S rRNA maturation protein [Vezdaea aestivalis]